MTVYYTKEHEWVSVEGDSATVGITDFAQGQLGDVVFVEVPEAGRVVSQGRRGGGGRIGQGGLRRLRAGLAARSPRATRRWSTSPAWSTPTRRAKAGSSG